ncbi:MAG: MaoC/PaaZ C-terminal domain-containing protein [Xanthomonadales bacterium]|nr:MaoC/PaaZ C-terminal domain-containing protein [Xanthomonadales bacterium]
MASDRIEFERTFRQADFDRFAELSGDRNPIHVDHDFSARTRFGRTVSHGLLLLTVVRGLLERLHPGARQLRQNAMFPAPTYADEAMSFSVETAASEGATRTVSFRVERCADHTVTCQGEAILQLPDQAL